MVDSSTISRLRILHLGLGHYGVWNPKNYQYPFTIWKKVGFVRNSKIHNPKFCKKVEVNVESTSCKSTRGM